MIITRPCYNCESPYQVEGTLVASPANRLCPTCRRALGIPDKKPIRVTVSKALRTVNFVSNVPQGTEVASVFPFKSSSSSSIYECRLYTNGATSCNCPGWTRRVNNDGSRECKHTREVDTKKSSILAALKGLTGGFTSGSVGSYASVQSYPIKQPKKQPVPVPEAPKPIRRFDLDA